MGTDNFFKKRKARTISKKRVEQKAVLIALEDTKSSRLYFEALLKDKGFRGEVVIAKNIGTNPKKVLEALQKHKQKDKKTKFEKEWIVIDRDEWRKDELKGVVESAKAKNICIAISNESYELWLLLHFEKITSHTSRDKLQKKLNRYFKDNFSIEYSKASADVYALLIGQQEDALKNAKYLFQKHYNDYGEIAPWSQNPITTLFELIECLNSFYSDKNCECYPNNLIDNSPN